MMELPAIDMLVQRVCDSSIGKTSVAGALGYLQSKHVLIGRHDSVEDFAIYAFDHAEDEPELKGIEFNFIAVRTAIARAFWSCEFYVGVSVLDRLIFEALRTNKSNPIEETIQALVDAELHSPGFVVYPLHSFGIPGAGLLPFLSPPSRVEAVIQPYGLVLTPQTNSIGKTIKILRSATTALGVTRRFSPDDLLHLFRSRSAVWLERNPLMILKLHSFPGDYYENQPFLIEQLRFATSLLFMLAALQSKGPGRPDPGFSSSSEVNNTETLNIGHYLVFYPHPSRRDLLEAQCVPMGGRRSPELVELSDLPIELDPAFGSTCSDVHALVAALKRIESTLVEDRFIESKARTTELRVCRKFADALTFFRRSMQRSDHPDEAVVYLMIAFEVLLTDDYSSGVAARIQRRLALALHEQADDAATLVSPLATLYKARCQVVHEGRAKVEVDIQGARKAFVKAFVALAGRIDDLPRTSPQPIGDLLGDRTASDHHTCPDCGHEHQARK